MLYQNYIELMEYYDCLIKAEEILEREKNNSNSPLVVWPNGIHTGYYDGIIP
jgi:hypothetical protein